MTFELDFIVLKLQIIYYKVCTSFNTSHWADVWPNDIRALDPEPCKLGEHSPCIAYVVRNPVSAAGVGTCMPSCHAFEKKVDTVRVRL